MKVSEFDFEQVNVSWVNLLAQFGQKLLIQTAHHNFLESRHPEVTKNQYYVLSTKGAKKRHHLMDYNELK